MVIKWLLVAVSREVVAKSLEDNEIVMLVPGGQHEIFTSRSFSPKVVISRKHKGFIRMAMRYGSSLVPIFSMGEWMVLDIIFNIYAKSTTIIT